MKRLFWVSIALLLLISCRTTVTGETESIPEDSAGWYDLLQVEESIENRYNLLYSLYSEGKYESVIGEAENAILLYPSYTRILKIKAAAERELSLNEEYLSSLALILEREGADEELRDLYLDALIENGEKEKALSFASETISLYPENEKAIEILAETSAFYTYLKETLQSQV